MHTIQLNPPIPVETPRGHGLAILATMLPDKNCWLWTISLDDTQELLIMENDYIRYQKAIVANRLADNRYLFTKKINSERKNGI